MFVFLTRRPIATGSVLFAITLVLVCMGVAGLSAWQKSRARSLALG